MIKFPDAIIINDDVLLEAMMRLSPIGFKVYMYVYYTWSNYEEWGHGYASRSLETLEGVLQLNYDDLLEGFIENRCLSYIDGFLVVYHPDDDSIYFRWRVDKKQDSGFNIEKRREWDSHWENVLIARTEEIHSVSEIRERTYTRGSSHWQAIRKQALERDGHKCTECEETENLHVHHLTYENEGAELLDDLQVLCRDCHSRKPKRKTMSAPAK